ncbi:MAG: thiamine pyrophosphate-dependent enzyme [Thermoprotei archaeon]
MDYTVADIIVSVLGKFGVRRVYGVPGDSINPLIEAIRKSSNVEFIQVRHEEGGALAAGFEAKYSGRLTAVLGTSGPGSVHLLNGLYNARLEHAPVIALTGQVRTDTIGFDSPQEVDLLKLFDDVSVFNRQIVNPISAERMINQACRSSLIKKGVSHLVLPVDVLRAKVEFENKANAEIPQTNYVFDVKKAEELINASSKPVILIGGGARGVSDELNAFAERIGAPIVYSLNGKGVLPEVDPKVMGGLGLLGARPSAVALGGADLLIMLGSSFPFTEFLPNGVPIIQVDIEPENIGKRTDVLLGIVSTVRGFLSAVHPNEKHDKYYLKLQDAKREWLGELEKREKAADTPIPPQALVRRICEMLPRDAIIVCDVGLVTLWCAQNLRLNRPYEFYTSSWLGTMGCGVPGALGISFSSSKPVIALVGDGGFTMTMMEMLTAVKYNRPIKVVVFNNSKLGLIKIEQELMGYQEFGTELHNPNFAKLAESMGAIGIRLENTNQMEDAIHMLMEADKPALLDAVVSPSEAPASPF